MNIWKKLNILFFTIIALVFFSTKAYAQQTIFNVPSADLTEKGMIFFQHQSSFSNKFTGFDNNFVLGVGKNSELDITLFDVGTKNIQNEVLALGFKSVIPLLEKSQTKFTFGHLIPISLRGHGVGGYTYSHLSTVLPRINTRLTSGRIR